MMSSTDDRPWATEERCTVIGRIARKEMTEMFRDGRFQLAAAIVGRLGGGSSAEPDEEQPEA